MPIVLIYDGECTLCLAAKNWMEKRALREQIELLPCQSPEREQRYPHISTQQCLSAIQLVLPNNEVLQGADAIPEILLHLKRWRWVEKILRARLFRKLAPFVYDWIARNRQIISCALPSK